MHRPQERHEWVKMHLRLAGTSLSEVARELGVAPTTVTSVSQGDRRSRRIESTIARHLGMTPDALWPERYADRKDRAMDSAREKGARDAS